MSVVKMANSDGLIRVGMSIPAAINSGIRGDDNDNSIASDDSFESTKPPDPHHIKLLALSAELMNPLTVSVESRVHVSLIEDALNRRRGRRESRVHWDSVKIKGKEFALQRGDTSITSIPVNIAQDSSFAMRDGVSTIGADDESGSAAYLRCDMCQMTFERSSVSGVITMKRILEARKLWGVAQGGKKNKTASYLYGPARLCIFCNQFFCSEDGSGDDGGIVPVGVGCSDERVSLTLQNMASNKPLPDKPLVFLGGKNRTWQRGGGRGRGRMMSRDRKWCGLVKGTSGMREVNFSLDALIKDEEMNISETDLAGREDACATQSSTADERGAELCIATVKQTLLKRGGYNRTADSKLSHHQVKSSTRVVGCDNKKTGKKLTNTSNSVAAAEGSPAAAPREGRGAVTPPSAKSTNAGAASQTSNTIMAARESTHQTSSLSSTGSCSFMEGVGGTAGVAAAAHAVCSRTRREDSPWWEVDLGDTFPVRCIRVHHPDRRMQATKAGATPYVDISPFWVMTGAVGFGPRSWEGAREEAIMARRYASHGKLTIWDLGLNKFARSVRVQVEGVKSLQLARIGQADESSPMHRALVANRVEVIKGGGTRQAQETIRQHLTHRLRSGVRGNVEDPIPKVSSTFPAPGARPRRASEHTMMVKRLQRFYEKEAVGKGQGHGHGQGLDHGEEDGQGRGQELGQGQGQGQAQTQAQGQGQGQGPGQGPGASQQKEWFPGSSGWQLARADGVAGVTKNRDETGGKRLHMYPPEGGEGDRGSRRRKGEGRGKKSQSAWRSQRECVSELFLRAEVGYGWVDEWHGQERRIRGPYSEGDVAVLEWATGDGDKPGPEAAANVVDSRLRLDPGELCGDLRRLQLQVQTKASNKNYPALTDIRESALLLQVFSSGIIESLPDALARVEAQLPQERRPLSLGWTEFLGLMRHCSTGTTAGISSLFKKTHDHKLDFLMRKRRRPPPPPRTALAQCQGFHPKGGNGSRDGRVAGASTRAGATAGSSTPGAMEMGATSAQDGRGGMATPATTPSKRAQTAPARADKRGSGGGPQSMEEEDGMMSVSTSGVRGNRGFGGVGVRGGGSSLTSVTTGTPEGGGMHGSSSQGWGGDRSRGLGEGRCGGRASGGGGRGASDVEDRGEGGNKRRGKNGEGAPAAPMASIMRPQGKDLVGLGYPAALERRRCRQRECLERAPPPDMEPKRPYKTCGLCQLPYPADSLAASVSFKVLGAFLEMAGAPSGRFGRKSARLCAYHRLNVCVYCSQFFNPDYPGGVVHPLGQGHSRHRRHRRLGLHGGEEGLGGVGQGRGSGGRRTGRGGGLGYERCESADDDNEGWMSRQDGLGTAVSDGIGITEKTGVPTSVPVPGRSQVEERTKAVGHHCYAERGQAGAGPRRDQHSGSSGGTGNGGGAATGKNERGENNLERMQGKQHGAAALERVVSSPAGDRVTEGNGLIPFFDDRFPGLCWEGWTGYGGGETMTAELAAASPAGPAAAKITSVRGGECREGSGVGKLREAKEAVLGGTSIRDVLLARGAVRESSMVGVGRS